VLPQASKIAAEQAEAFRGQGPTDTLKQFHCTLRSTSVQGRCGGFSGKIGQPTKLVLAVSSGQATRGENVSQLDSPFHVLQSVLGVLWVDG